MNELLELRYCTFNIAYLYYMYSEYQVPNNLYMYLKNYQVHTYYTLSK